MKTKKICIYAFIIVFLLGVIFFIIFSDQINSRFLGASISNTSNDSVIIQAAENMIYDNIDDYDGEKTITVSEIIKNKYLDEEMLDSEVDKETRIIFTVKEGKITDIYLKNRLFINEFSCSETCYMDEKKYIAFNNDIYMIMKIDIDKKIYITKGNIEIVNYNDIYSEMKKISNKFDKNIILNVINVSYSDIENSNLLNVDNNLYIKKDNQYQIYNFASKKFEKGTNLKAGIIPVIVLNDEVTYEMGDGSRLNPYIINK